jgi:pimeloyl-ACP methyl ester carboxylesterase
VTAAQTTTPQELTLRLPHLHMRALAWGPDDGRLALCLHGFPDSAWSWRKLGPRLAARGFRVVAPFTRGYAPTALPTDDDYSIGALMYDALAVHHHLGAPDDAVLIGHDWGAFTANGLAAHPDSPFSEHIVMSVPSIAAMTANRHSPAQEARMGLRQLRMSWYILFFQMPWLPERLAHKVIPRLWRDWEPPGSDLTEDIANTQRALPARSHRKAAISYYRALARPTRSASVYADLNQYRFAAPRGRILHMQGALDGAIHVGYSDFLADALPDGSRVHIVSDGGHFLQVQHPEEVRDAILGHVGLPR